jgi:hypothetical protein
MSKIVTIIAATALLSVVSSADAKGIVVGAVHGHHHAKMKAKAG